MKGGFILDLTAIPLLAAVPGGRLFGLDEQTLFVIGVQLFNACLLAFFLSRILYKPVQNFLRKRADKIKNQLDHAAMDMEKATGLRLQYEKSLGNIDQERSEILASARKLATDKHREITNEARAEAEAIKAQAKADVRREQEQMSEALRLHIIDVSSRIAEKFITQAMDKETQDRLFTKTMHELEEAAWPN